jgi:YidC/Oxa1 family membrane protein insertase
MNQTRVFLIFAWLMVAVLLWMEWSREKAAPTPAPTTTSAPAAAQSVPGATPGAIPSAQVPGAPGQAAVQAQASATPASQRVTVTTDVLRLVLDGGRVLDAELLQFPQTKDEGSPPVRLLTEDPRIRTARSVAGPAKTRTPRFPALTASSWSVTPRTSCWPRARTSCESRSCGPPTTA